MGEEWEPGKRLKRSISLVAAVAAGWLWWRDSPWIDKGTEWLLKLALAHTEIEPPKSLVRFLELVPPLTAAALAPLVFELPPIRKAVSFVKANIFPSFDQEFVELIPPAKAWDPLWVSGVTETGEEAMEWSVPPVGSLRRPPYEALLRFASTGSYTGKHGPWQRSAELEKESFVWTIMVGESGVGKTRLAVEFLRQHLGQMERIMSLRKKSRIGYGFHALTDWFRRVSPFHGFTEDSAWDIGWIKPEISFEEGPEISYDREHVHRCSLDGYGERLAKWRPRKPTALLLDDPVGADAGLIVRGLVEQSNAKGPSSTPYHYPVRLLIVSQTLPTEMVFEPKHEGADITGWHSRMKGFRGPVVVLEGEAAAIPVSEIERQLPTLSRIKPRWLRSPEELRKKAQQISNLTEGNAFLIEIAAHMVLAGEPLDGLTAEDLVEARAKRILEAMNNPKLTTSQRLLVASATIAGADPGYIPEVYRELLFEHKDLFDRAYSVSARLGEGRSLPAIRPTRIGDAFIRLMLRQSTPETGQQVVKDAWRLNPAGVLRTIERRGARADELAKTLRATTLPGVDHWGVALAYTKSASVSPAGERTPGFTTDALGVACTALQECVPADLWRIRATDQILALCQAENSRYHVNRDSIYAAFFFVIGKLVTPDAAARSIDDLSYLLGQASEVVTKWDCGIKLFERDVRSVMSQSMRAIERRLAAGSDGQMPRDDERRALDLGRLTTLSVRSFAAWDDLEECRKILTEFQRMKSSFASQREFRLLHAQIQKDYARAMPSHTEETLGDAGVLSAEAILEIAGPFASERAFCMVSASAWGEAARATSSGGNLPATEAALDRMLQVLEGLAIDREYRLRVQFGWRQVAYARVNVGDIPGCRAAIQECLDLAGPHGDERLFRLEQATCYNMLTHACGFRSPKRPAEPEMAKEAAREAVRVSGPFCDEFSFRERAAEAWRNVAVASENGSTSDTEFAATKVSDACLPFRNFLNFVLIEASSWVTVARAHRLKREPVASERAARRVVTLTEDFAYDRQIRMERVSAWEQVSLARGNAHDRKGTEDAAVEILTLAGEFKDECEFRLIQAFSRMNIALSRTGEAALPATRRAIEEVRQLAGADVKKPLFRLALAVGERRLAEIFSSGKERDVKRCVGAASRVQSLAGDDTDDPQFAEELMLANRAVLAVRGEPREFDA